MNSERIHQSRASLPVDSETKALLTRLTRDDEMWDEFSERIVVPEEPIRIGAWSHEAGDRREESNRDSRND